jgi:hypothetical protein
MKDPDFLMMDRARAWEDVIEAIVFFRWSRIGFPDGPFTLVVPGLVAEERP